MRTVAGNGLDDAAQHLVHQHHVQQMKGEEVGVEDRAEDGTREERLQIDKWWQSNITVFVTWSARTSRQVNYIHRQQRDFKQDFEARVLDTAILVYMLRFVFQQITSSDNGIDKLYQ